MTDDLKKALWIVLKNMGELMRKDDSISIFMGDNSFWFDLCEPTGDRDEKGYSGYKHTASYSPYDMNNVPEAVFNFVVERMKGDPENE